MQILKENNFPADSADLRRIHLKISVMKRPCRNASQTNLIKMRELHPIPLKTFNFNWMKQP
jgi:hypothetical protein